MSVLQVMLPVDGVTPSGELDPEYGTPFTVSSSKPDSVWKCNTVSGVLSAVMTALSVQPSYSDVGTLVASRSQRLPDAQLDVHTQEPSALVVRSLLVSTKGATAPRSESPTNSARADACQQVYRSVAIAPQSLSFDAMEQHHLNQAHQNQRAARHQIAA